MQAPTPDPRAPTMDYAPKSAELDIDSDAGLREAQRSQSVVEAFAAAHSCLCERGKLAEKAVRDSCERACEPVGYAGLLRLKDGLGALGAFWQLAKI